MSGYILLVDDNVDLRELLRSALEYLGHEVVTASNGQDALDRVAAKGSSPSFVLLDLEMPVMDGKRFLEQRQTEPLLEAAPVVVMTAQSPELIPELEDAETILQKPVDLAVIVDLIRKHSACP